jgi:hypothetical protein
VEVHALDLGRDQEPLRLFAEQEHGGVGRLADYVNSNHVRGGQSE